MDYQKWKKIYNNFFENLETSITYKLVRTRNRLKSKKFLQKGDKIDKAYKKEVKQYWKKYGVRVNYRWYTLYANRTGIQDVRFIPKEIYYTTVDGYFNNRKMGWGVNDKNYYSIWFSDIKQPKTINRIINGIYYDPEYHMITKQEWIEKLKKYDQFIVKPSIENGGSKGIEFYDKTKNQETIEQFISQFKEQNYIIQEIVKQHKNLDEIHHDSLNTIRVMSLLKDNKVNIVSTILKMGANGVQVDNVWRGGLSCGILENGELKEIAHDHMGNSVTKHPQGFVFKGHKIENFDKVIDLVTKAHERMGHFRLISWDIAIGEDGEPILVEANMRNGGINIHQFNNGSLFGDMTDEVLAEVFRKKEK